MSNQAKLPLYQQLKEDLRYKIEEGEFAYGQKIPSEPQLMTEYGMSRITVRHALDELSRLGYLRKIHGKGTFVDKPKVWRKIENVQSFEKACALIGMSASHRLIGRDIMKPTSEHKTALGLTDRDKIIHTLRVLSADEHPVMLEHCFFPLNHEFAFIQDEDLSQSLYTLLSRYGINPTASTDTTLEAVGAPFAAAEMLGVPVGEPTFYVSALLNDSSLRPLYFERSYIVGSRYKYRVN